MHELLPLGGTFAGLHVESLVGRGGMGVVYRARQDGPARTVALKVLAPELDGDAAARRRFLGEIELLATVEHPHVVPIYDAGEWDGRLWLTMRLLEGPSLRTLVERRGPLHPARMIELLSPIAAALDAIHAAGLVHGDVGPANVLLDVHGEPYLTDFGIARRLGAPAERLGTLAYLAPERIGVPADGGSDSPILEAAGPAADRYSFAGLILYALTGRPPFEGATPDDVLRAHLGAPPPSASARRTELPAQVDAVLARGLAKAPSARYASALDLLAAVRAALGRLGPAADPPDPLAPTSPIAQSEAPSPVPSGRGRRPRLGAVSGAALGAVAVLLLTGWTFGFGLVPVAGSLGLPTGARSGPSASAGSSARPTVAPTPKPTPTPTEAPRLGDPADVARLRVLLPDGVRDACRSAAVAGGALVAGGDVATPTALAAVTCRLGDTPSEGSVRYVLFGAEGALDVAWSTTLGIARIGSGGRCESGTSFVGRWRQPGAFLGLGPARTGRVACWLGRDGTARVDWTVDGVPVLATLRRSDEDVAEAYRTWAAADLSPRESTG